MEFWRDKQGGLTYFLQMHAKATHLGDVLFGTAGFSQGSLYQLCALSHHSVALAVKPRPVAYIKQLCVSLTQISYAKATSIVIRNINQKHVVGWSLLFIVSSTVNAVQDRCPETYYLRLHYTHTRTIPTLHRVVRL